MSHAGGVALLETVRAAGLDRTLSEALASWRKPTAVHDPAKVLLDLAVSLALGGDCLADIAVLRAEPGVYGPVASDPTVSRTIDALASDGPRALAAINRARAVARARVWELAGEHAPDHEATAQAPLVIDVDATLVTAHSDKEHAAPTFKRGYGHHALWAFATTGRTGPASRSPCSSGPVTLAATPQPTTSPCCATRCASSPTTSPVPGLAVRSSCGSTGPARRTPCSTG